MSPMVSLWLDEQFGDCGVTFTGSFLAGANRQKRNESEADDQDHKERDNSSDAGAPCGGERARWRG